MGRNIVVVAHPDDEILWLSSVVSRVDQVILCFGAPYQRPQKAESRARAVAQLDLPGVATLSLPETGSRTLVDLQNPKLTETGIALSDQAAQARYDASFATLLETLRPILKGADNVYTHNPWGEYGHTEHIQVYRVVQALQAEQKFTVWFSNYVSAQALPLARQFRQVKLWQEKQTLPTNKAVARRAQKIYQAHKVWTWSPWCRWPATETLYSQPYGPSEHWRSMQNEVLYDARRLRLWCPIWVAKRRLT